MGMPIKIIPSIVLEDIAKTWENGAAAAGIFGNKIEGQIHLHGSLLSKEPLWYEDTVEPGYFQISAGSQLQDFAIMLWLSRCPQIKDATIGRCWDAGYGVGADSLKNGILIQLSVPEESVELLSTRRLLDQYGLTSADELEECEELLNELEDLYEEQLEEEGLEPRHFISDFSQEYRVEARDDIQQAFLHAMHESLADLSKVSPFDELKTLGGDWSLSHIDDWQVSAETFLKPIDFDDTESIASAFAQLPEEHWKEHRERVRSLLKNLPAQITNNVNVFKVIIPEVAAWPLKYAGPDVCSDPTIIDLAIEADLRHGFSPTALKYASDTITHDEELVGHILDRQPGEYANLPDEMRTKKDFAIKFAASGNLWKCIPEELIKDRDVLKAYISSNPSFPYSSIPEECHNDLELAEALINAGGDFSSLPSHFQASNDLFLLYLSNASERELSNYEIKRAFDQYIECAGLGKTEIPIDFLQNCVATNQGIIEFLDLNQFSADELVKVVTGIEAPTLKQKFEALKVLAEKAPQGDSTLNLIIDIISELQKADDYSDDSKDVAEAKENAKQGALNPLEAYVNNPDAFGPEGLSALIDLSMGFYRMIDHFSDLASQTEALKSNPF